MVLQALPNAHVLVASIIAMPYQCHFYGFQTQNLTACEEAYNALVPGVAAMFPSQVCCKADTCLQSGSFRPNQTYTLRILFLRPLFALSSLATSWDSARHAPSSLSLSHPIPRTHSLTHSWCLFVSSFRSALFQLNPYTDSHSNPFRLSYFAQGWRKHNIHYQLVSTHQHTSAGIHIYSWPPPHCQPTAQSRHIPIPASSSACRAIALELLTACHQVTFVDMKAETHMCLHDEAYCCPPHLHPNGAGYGRMASVWEAAIRKTPIWRQTFSLPLDNL